MIEYDNVKDALIALMEICDAKEITIDGEPVTLEYFQELAKERVCNICDLLGLEEIYLK